jgi:WD40 repeat protein
VQFSPDGRFFATVAGGLPPKLWNAVTREEVKVAFGDTVNESWGAPIAFSPDSKTLAFGSAKLGLCDLATRQVVATLEGHKSPIMCIRFSPDGKTLATGSHDHSVKLWNFATRQEVTTLEGHTGPVSGLAFSSDGTILASCGEDKTIRLWRAISPAEAEQVKGAKTE